MPAPAAPTNFTIEEYAILHLTGGALSNKSAVLLSWSNYAPTAQHRIEKSIGGTYVLARIVSVGESTATLRNLPNESSIPLRIRSESEEGSSDWVTVVAATGALATAGNPPLAPASFTVSENTSYTALLEWEDQSKNEAYFEVEIRRGGDVRGIIQIPGLTEQYDLDLTTLFSPASSVPNQLYTAKIRARGGKGTAGSQPPIVSAWSNDYTFRTGPPKVLITSAGAVTAERGQAFTYTIQTSTPCTGFTASDLPAGLALGSNTISGNLTAPPQVYTVHLTATDGLTTGTRDLRITVIPSSIVIYSQTTATGTLGAPFSYQILARRSGGSAALTYSISGAPLWLHVNAATGQLSGTPEVPGVFIVQLGATDGSRIGSAILTITVPALTITSAATITIFVGEPFTHQLTASSASASWEVFDPPAWLSLAGSTLTGTAPASGTFDVDIVATIDDDGASQTLRILVKPLISAADEIHGWQGDPMIEVLAYEGDCTVEHWYLSGGPAGIEIGALACPGAYGSSNRVVAFTGTPTTPGFFDATVIAHLCCGGVPRLIRRPVRFVIDGGLFLSWLHSDRRIYDLQMQVRGNVDQRPVESYYQRSAIAASSATLTTEDNTTPGIKKVTNSTFEQEQVGALLLAAKRGDSLRLAIVIRDGRKILAPADGLTVVGLTFRRPIANDEDYLINKEGVLTVIGEHAYYAVAIDVTPALLDELMAGDEVTKAIELRGEIHITLNEIKISSATFTAVFSEDLHR